MELNRRVNAIFITVVLLMVTIISYTAVSEKPTAERFEETEIEFEIIISIKNLGVSPAFDIPLRLGIPYDHKPVQTLLSMDYSILPERFSNGSWGNTFAHFTIEQIDPGQTWNITIMTTIKLLSIDYNLQKDKVGEYTNETDKYLVESPLINVNDPSIRELAAKLIGDSDDIFDTIWKTYEWVIDNIVYQQIPGEYDARTTLRNGEGGSAELSNLFVALLRANKIPAQRVSGWGNYFEEGEELHITRFSHGWAEFYIPGYGWIPADVTWGKNHKFDSFAKTDAKHVILTHGAGIHYYRRGPYAEPYGETELDSDYRLFVKNVERKNLSFKRTLIQFGIFVGPVPFVIFIVVKKMGMRKI